MSTTESLVTQIEQRGPGQDFQGLGSGGRDTWPTRRWNGEGSVMDFLKPDSESHRLVRDYITSRIRASEQEMTRFYSRWNGAEYRTQSFIHLKDYEKAMKDKNNAGRPPKITSLTIPYSYAAIDTLVTYMFHVFVGARPMFAVGSYNGDQMESAANLETMLQYNVDEAQLVPKIHQLLWDGEVYGLSAVATTWKKIVGPKTQWQEATEMQQAFGAPRFVSSRPVQTLFMGTEVQNIDPFMFFPDPSVPMKDVATKGEYVFWREYIGLHDLQIAEVRGDVKWVSAIGKQPVNTYDGISVRNIQADGEAAPGRTNTRPYLTESNYAQIDQGSVLIVPRELGLGDSNVPEKWIFTLANKTQIIHAEKLDLDHGQHPVVVSEPYSSGYAFGHSGLVDFVASLQDAISWLGNSHIHQTRAAMQNLFVVDPLAVEIQDIKDPDPGGIIRLKSGYLARDIKTVIQQIPIQDMTQGHLQEIPMWTRMADNLSGTTENTRGLQTAGGRKTATEIRTAADSANSRSAKHTRIVSSQMMSPLTRQMGINYQQFLDNEFFVRVGGRRDANLMVSPAVIAGEFFYPIHDGTLPSDRILLVDAWKEIFTAAATYPVLGAEIKPVEVFKYLATLSGVKNLDKFLKTEQEKLEEQIQEGNLLPSQEVQQQGVQTPGIRPPVVQ